MYSQKFANFVGTLEDFLLEMKGKTSFTLLLLCMLLCSTVLADNRFALFHFSQTEEGVDGIADFNWFRFMNK